MSQVSIIREMAAKGSSLSEISRELHIARNTVAKYVHQEDFSPQPPVREKRPSKLDKHKPLIDKWIADDKSSWHKQRHTAKRIYERLIEEADYDGSYSTVCVYVKEARETKFHHEYLELVWQPGTAQVDFGEADFLVSGKKSRFKYLVVSFPYSNMGYAQVFGGETAECVCQGLQDIFEHIGAVPELLVFDNATGVGRRVRKEIRLSGLFERFKMHYLLNIRFCNPESGHEKGNVERKVGALRSNLFVPIPRFGDIIEYNAALLLECDKRKGKTHYRKGEAEGDLFAKDTEHMMGLPRKPFCVRRFERMKADGYGKVCVDGCHHYSTHPSFARREVTIGIGAHVVEVIDANGEVVISHPRIFGSERTDTVNVASSLPLLTRNVGAWKNSQLREMMSPKVRDYLDSQNREQLKHYLTLLSESCNRCGLQATLSAVDMVAERSDEPNFFEVSVLAARIEGYGLDTPPESGPELSIYDDAFLPREGRA